jgi:hypothetical protein
MPLARRLESPTRARRQQDLAITRQLPWHYPSNRLLIHTRIDNALKKLLPKLNNDLLE